MIKNVQVEKVCCEQEVVEFKCKVEEEVCRKFEEEVCRVVEEVCRMVEENKWIDNVESIEDFSDYYVIIF